ncbi:MAG: peptidase [Pseudomonadota bacterium]
MTYCIGLKLEAGLILLSDTRTNAGLDNIARFRKMLTWHVEGERALAIVTSGNLSITQGVVTRLQDAIARDKARGEAGNGVHGGAQGGAHGRASESGGSDEPIETLLNAPSMFRAAQLVGDTMREVQDRHRKALQEQGAEADASILLAGQRKGGRQRLFLIYSAGNFIEATWDTPFFQLGEHKYGKPILDRVIDPDTSIPTALKAAMVSMDSTLRSNLSVGMPLDLAVIETDTFRFAAERRIEQDDPDFANISARWSVAIKAAFESLPEMASEAATAPQVLSTPEGPDRQGA